MKKKRKKNTTFKRTPNPLNPGLSFVALIKTKVMLCVILMFAFNLIEQLQLQGVFFFCFFFTPGSRSHMGKNCSCSGSGKVPVAVLLH